MSRTRFAKQRKTGEDVFESKGDLHSYSRSNSHARAPALLRRRSDKEVYGKSLAGKGWYELAGITSAEEVLVSSSPPSSNEDKCPVQVLKKRFSAVKDAFPWVRKSPSSPSSSSTPPVNRPASAPPPTYRGGMLRLPDRGKSTAHAEHTGDQGLAASRPWSTFHPEIDVPSTQSQAQQQVQSKSQRATSSPPATVQQFDSPLQRLISNAVERLNPMDGYPANHPASPFAPQWQRLLGAGQSTAGAARGAPARDNRAMQDQVEAPVNVMPIAGIIASLAILSDMSAIVFRDLDGLTSSDESQTDEDEEIDDQTSGGASTESFTPAMNVGEPQIPDLVPCCAICLEPLHTCQPQKSAEISPCKRSKSTREVQHLNCDCELTLHSCSSGATKVKVVRKKRKALHVLACKHTFHRRCIRRWLKEQPSCPLCRHPVVAWRLHRHIIAT